MASTGVTVDVNALLRVDDGTPSGRPLLADDFRPVVGSRFSARASRVLSGERVVTTDMDGRLIYADAATLVGLHGPLWLTTQSASANALVEVVTFGEHQEPSWSWTPKLPVYLTSAGALSQTPPSAGMVVQIATALTATSVFVDPRPPITLV